MNSDDKRRKNIISWQRGYRFRSSLNERFSHIYYYIHLSECVDAKDDDCDCDGKNDDDVDGDDDNDGVI